MRIAILGPLEVSADDRPIPVAGTRLRGLLIRLALDPGRTVSVGTLITDLWPEAPPKRPEHALHELVSRLRRTLPTEAPIRSGAGGYLLDIAGLSVDIHRFERLVRGGSVSTRRGDLTRAVHQLRDALALWRGPALSDIATLPFAAATATRLDELRVIATESALAIELPARAGDPLLITELEALLAAHPLRERPRLLHIQALHDAARTAEALTAYDRYRTLLATELGIDPGPELAALHLKLLRGEAPGGQAGDSPDSPVALRDPHIFGATGASSAARLRVPLTRFIGRELELSEVGRLVGSERLVTLVGPGGAGKTRLAVAVANEAGGRFAGGVGMAELAAVTDSSDLPQAVAAALGVAPSRTVEHSAADPMGLLAEALPTAPTLLVLDNCEHLIDGVARFAEDLLGRVPQLRVLATSRQLLGIAGETLWETAPLAVPPANSADVADYPSVRLFLDRAAAVRPELAPTEADLETVADICRRLDGLPLALELAAAKLRVMPLSVLHSRLDDRFTVLSGGNRTALPATAPCAPYWIGIGSFSTPCSEPTWPACPSFPPRSRRPRPRESAWARPNWKRCWTSRCCNSWTSRTPIPLSPHHNPATACSNRCARTDSNTSPPEENWIRPRQLTWPTTRASPSPPTHTCAAATSFPGSNSSTPTVTI
ncbi:AAA family ATPase [Nocardia tengchongensis]|uniref:AAA family ATPase n=1 Tax=Nocardia tengchongensis TaxID=2055889 RepID=A0ABX8CVT2_9NOCA|nr:BTAD domain-containing putative transcriptional regulator [Nocardia tengchongensis]QVI24005.1 AAA family ATPase [Nocardia tengchongensis]